MALYRLIYLSEATELVTQDEIMSIFSASQERNKELKITGLLLATDRHYVQVLEGEKKAVNHLYHQIAKDKRHKNLEILSYGLIEARGFPEWTMKIVRIQDLHKGIRNTLLQKYGSGNEDFCLPNDPEIAFSMLYDIYLITK